MKNTIHILGKENDLDVVQNIFLDMTTIGYASAGKYNETGLNKVQKCFDMNREEGNIAVSVERPQMDDKETRALSNAIKDILEENKVTVTAVRKMPNALVIQSTKKTGVGKFFEQVFG